MNMNESINRKPAKVSMTKDPEMRIPMRVRCVAWFTALVFAYLPALAFAQESCPGMHVKILNIRNSEGSIACALFESPDGFPKEYLRCATNVMVIKIREKQARFNFLHIPPGNVCDCRHS